MLVNIPNRAISIACCCFRDPAVDLTEFRVQTTIYIYGWMAPNKKTNGLPPHVNYKNTGKHRKSLKR